ncbi:MAG: glycosyltransferase family 9 protein [Elusimicrobia bacterium]|nr:glycosyltransferase family 9 protein [Elusimicrobiota bacterium]
MGPGILIIVYKGIGDVLLTTPLLRALKKGIPDSRIYFLTRRPSRPILENNPNLSGVFCREDKPLKAIRAAGIDIAVDFMRSASSGFYALFSGADKRLAFSYRGGRLFYNVMPEQRPGDGYTVYDRLQLVEPLGVRPDGHSLDLSVPASCSDKAEAFLASAGVKTGDLLVTMDITSPRDHRRWPAENFAKLADSLAASRGAKVVFLWGPGELEYVKSAMSAARDRHLLCPDLGLLELAALLKRASLHVGTSSAPMHLAVSQGTPTFTVYAPQNSPQSWSPPGSGHGWVQGELSALSFAAVLERLEAHISRLQGAKQ